MQKSEKFILVIFGASGDLAKRKLIPALFDLFKQGMLPKYFKIVGIGRKNMQSDIFKSYMQGELETKFLNNLSPDNIKKEILDFCKYLSYFEVDPNNDKDYFLLKQYLETLSEEITCKSNYLYYFAIPPFTYATVAKNLHNAGLTCQDSGWKRVIIEKPFGRDLASATELNSTLLRFFFEDQIYRIDHYLGKETVQNILVTRFSNSIFEPLWNRNYIEYVEITSTEAQGVGLRAGYYDTAGALRDMLQNHLLQLLGIVAMEPPMNAESTLIRNEMVKVFKALRKMKVEDVPNLVVRGQYMSSNIKGVHYKGYREENGIAPNSKTDTYVAMKCYVDNWRWSGVPFYIRTGKCMPTRVTEIVIHFRPTPHKIFEQHSENYNKGNQ
ncbi:MAG: glucose-6-phosphate dehydrogenase, partial [Bacteroidales bacterium]